MLYNAQRDRLLGKPSIETEACPFCGRVAMNRHHILPKGMGGTRRRDIPTVTVCGMGNASGCHGRLHDHTLELDWDDEAGWWHRLADLVDRPTCKNASGYCDVFQCSACGCKVEITAEVGIEHGGSFHVPFMPSYCPSCGAEASE